MHARIDSPALTVPGALENLQGLAKAIKKTGVPEHHALSRPAARKPDQRLQHLRRPPLPRARMAGEHDERIFLVGAWREARLLQRRGARSACADRGRPPVWPIARTQSRTRLWEGGPSGATTNTSSARSSLAIASINTWNRINALTRQISGEWIGKWLGSTSAADTAA